MVYFAAIDFMRFCPSKYCLVTIVLSVCLSANVHAQKGVWDRPKDNSKKALKKVDKGKKKVQFWKKHVKEWGMQEELPHQLSIGAKLNSDGWSGGVYYWNRKDARVKDVYMLSFSEIKHEKQIKQEGSGIYPQLGTPSPYVFGKINNLYTLQLGLGKEYLIFPKVIEDNISINTRFMIGASLAMLKPYYLRLIYEEYVTAEPIATLEEQQYTQAQEPFLKTGNKLGASPWTKGLGEIKYKPGPFAEFAVVIEPVQNSWFIQTITIGGNFAYYFKPLPILAEVKARPWQGSLFVALALGKRW